MTYGWPNWATAGVWRRSSRRRPRRRATLSTLEAQEAQRPSTASVSSRYSSTFSFQPPTEAHEVAAPLSNGRSVGSFAEQWQLR